MKKRFVSLKLSQQLAFVGCLFLFIPMLLLWYTILREQQNSAIKSRAQDSASVCAEAQAQAQRAAELCNMSTQVYMNTPQLIEYLRALKQEEEIGAAEMLAFYRTTVASLEKISLSNPDLYQIRVFAEADGINEMIPVLFGRERMSSTAWAERLSDDTERNGVWQFDYEDRIFSDYSTPHIMSLITEVTDPALGRLGTFEVSVRMDDVLPELFLESDETWTVLVDNNGECLAGKARVSAEELTRLAESENGVQYELDGEKVLVTKAALKGLGCSYLCVTSLSDIYRTMLYQSLYLLAVVLVAFAVMMLVMSRLTRRLLRGFYGTFDGIRAFANGDIDVAVNVDGEGEIADFTREVDSLLDNIRQLMRDNVERELQAQKAQMSALQNQINAHFIYNVLEAIKMMAEIDEEYEIADTVTTLGKLLRYSLKLEGGGVRLDREIDNISNYIALMNLRFDYVISLEVNVPYELLCQTIPKLSLQPIVENAVIHGAMPLAADSTITVTGAADREHGRFTLDITDRGRGMNEEALANLRRRIAGEYLSQPAKGNGIGLKNVHERIRMAFGEEYGLAVSSQPNAGTTVTVILPYHEEVKRNENNIDSRR